MENKSLGRGERGARIYTYKGYTIGRIGSEESQTE
jgi:hypothetical protein